MKQGTSVQPGTLFRSETDVGGTHVVEYHKVVRVTRGGKTVHCHQYMGRGNWAGPDMTLDLTPDGWMERGSTRNTVYVTVPSDHDLTQDAFLDNL